MEEKKKKYDVIWLDYRAHSMEILVAYLQNFHNLSVLILKSIDEAVERLPQIQFKVFALEIVLPFGRFYEGKLSNPCITGLRLIEEIQEGNIIGVSPEIDILVYTTSIDEGSTRRLKAVIGERNIFFKPTDPEKIALRIKEIIG